ncbi:hypothetical protein LINGRAHAP2_LOCUS3807, partial [Linum grandiflorum]
MSHILTEKEVALLISLHTIVISLMFGIHHILSFSPEVIDCIKADMIDVFFP